MDYKQFSLIFKWKKNASHTDLVSVMLIMIYRSPMSTQFVFVWLTHSYREHFCCWILKTLLRRIWWVCKYAADDVLPHFIAQFSPRLIYEVTSLHNMVLWEMSQLWETLRNYTFLCISCELPPECPPSAPSSLYARQLPTQEKWGIGRGGFLPQFTIFLIYVGKPNMGTHLLHLNAITTVNIWKSIGLKCTNYISYSNQPSLSLHGLQRKL